MITAGVTVRLIFPINDEDFYVGAGTIGVVAGIKLCERTDKPMFIVDFPLGVCGCYPEEIIAITPVVKGEWV